MARLTLTITDEDAPDEKAEASIDLKALDKCRDQDDICTLVGHVFITLLESMVEHAGSDSDGPMKKVVTRRLL